jgi:transmembrane sensor
MADVDRMGLWQRGELDLTDMTLGDAAREFARYSDTHIVIDQPSVAMLKVAGVYSTSDPVGFARAAALAHGLSIAVAPDGVMLSRQN